MSCSTLSAPDPHDCPQGPLRGRLAILCRSFREPPEHDARHGHVGEHLASLHEVLVVLRHAPIAADPRECSLDHPPARQHVEVSRNLWWQLPRANPDTLQPGPPVLHDGELSAERASQPVRQSTISRVGPDERNQWKLSGQALEQHLGATAIVQVGRVDADLEQVALGIHQHVPLAASDLLAPIIAARSTGLCGANRLAVDDGSCWLRRTPEGDPLALTQGSVDRLPGASAPPLRIVPAYRRPRRELVRDRPPLAAGA